MSNILFSVMLVPFVVLGSITGSLVFFSLVFGFCGIGYFVRYRIAARELVALLGTLSIVGLTSAYFARPQSDDYENVGASALAGIVVSVLLVGLLVWCVRFGERRANISGRAGFGRNGFVIRATFASYAVMVVMILGGLGGMGV